MEVEVRDLSCENVRELMELEVKPSQRGFVETVPECLEDARIHKEYNPVGLYVKGAPVGFAMYGCFNLGKKNERVWFDRLLIDKEEQGKGFGRKSFEEVLGIIEDNYDCDRVYLSVYKENKLATGLYKEYGFDYTGELDINGELIMVREVS